MKPAQWVSRPVGAALARVFGFTSGVLRNARTFHPDGRTFLGTVRVLKPREAGLAEAARGLAGAVLMRIGMGLAKRGWWPWLARAVPDAPSMSMRFYTAARRGEVRLARRGEDDLDVLFTAGGDRLYKLIWNLLTGGKLYGLDKTDYFRNRYFAQVPYRAGGGRFDLWLRVAADASSAAARPDGAEGREAGLSRAVASHAVLRIEAQHVASARQPFVPIAEIRFDQEVEIDQEALHFDPVAGRGFEPHGFFTELRKAVYPASARARPHSRKERGQREGENPFRRLGRYFSGGQRGGRSRPPLWLRLVRAAGALLLLAAAGSALYGAWRFLPNHPVRRYADVVEHFKYGSTGGEANLGFPFLIWQAAPLVCTDSLQAVAGDRLAPDFLQRVANHARKPDGEPEVDRKQLSREAYKAFGMIYESAGGQENPLPVGVSMRRNLGLDRVFVNCASCHSSTVRVSPESRPIVVPGMPANLLNLRAFERFYFACVSGERFNRDNLLAEIDALGEPLNWIDRYLVYPLAIWVMGDRVQFLASRLGFFAKQPDWGPGRVDTFSNAKGLFKLPWQQLPDWNTDRRVEPDQVGTADFPSIWLQGPRRERSSDGCPMELHWDGNNDMMEERNLSAAFGTGATPTYIDHRSIKRIETWLLTAEPPRFGDYFPVDGKLAGQGKPIYETYCAECHGATGRDFTGARVGHWTPIEEIRTDRYRLDNYTYELAVTQSLLYADQKLDGPPFFPGKAGGAPVSCKRWDGAGQEESSYRFKHFHKTGGYSNMPLDGIWLRAPYLHNGSVPTLWDLLKPAAQRPRTFYRGNDLYDPRNVGFVSDRKLDSNGLRYFEFNTQGVPGNGNSGHEGPRYGTQLKDSEKWALIEYLKTF